MAASRDVIIIGGAAVGSAAADFLQGPLGVAGRVAVIERDPTYAEAATPRSLGGIRQQFSTRENILMSRFGMEFVKRVGEHLSVDGDKPDVSLREQGYLFLASAEGKSVLQANHKTQRALGHDVVLLDPPALKARFPWLNTDGVALGSLGLKNEGWIDPYALLQAFRRKARALGATYIHDEVTGIERAGSRVAAVKLKSGGRLGCGVAVNAAGTRAHLVAAMAGLDIPIRPRKRFIYLFDCREPPEKAPLTIDATGVFFRPEGAGFVCGVSPPESDDPDCLDYELDYSLYENVVWPTLAERVPAFAAIKLVRAWACQYDYNTLDQNLIVGPHADCANFLLANGFTGHGLQQSPAAGRALAELIVHGGFRSIDLTRFGFARVRRNQPIKELNVV
ncbi:MAG: NAD(P)/FAD-dependent oxidoreductase [Rhodospirillales bacterium]